MSIEFTQYLMPDGAQKKIHIARPEAIETKAREIMSKGFRFEAEMLTTGEISLTISDGEEDLDIEVVSNGPDVPVAVDRMVERFHTDREVPA